jgi:hypothetical protein
MTFLFPVIYATVDALYWAIYKQRDMRIPPKPWVIFALAAVGALVGAKFLAPMLLGGAEDLLSTTLGALAGSRIANIGYAMLNPQPLPPQQR